MLSNVYKALADPTRRRVLQLLRERDMSAGEGADAPKVQAVPDGFYNGFAVACLLTALLLAWYYAKFDGEQYEILSMLIASVMP